MTEIPDNTERTLPDGGAVADGPVSETYYAPAIDLISRLKEMGPKMRPAERRVAEVVLSDVELAVNSSNAKLAQRANVSEPTVTRFCRALGCDGVRDFKIKLAQSLVVGPLFLNASPQGVGSDSPPYWNLVFQHANAAIGLAERQLDKNSLEKAVGLVANAGRVLVFGVGGGSTVLAQETQYRLFRFGLSITAYSDPLLMRMAASTLGPKDVVIALSATGLAGDVVESARCAQQYDASVVAITRPDSHLAGIADVALTVSVPDIEVIMKPTASRYAFQVIIDLLATGVGCELGEDAQEKLRRIKYRLMNLRDGELLEPLGD